MNLPPVFSPSYYNKFRCLASDCPESCCRCGWEIPLDDKTFEFYLSCGIEDIKENTMCGSDGDIIFRQNENGECRYLTPEGLCSLYLKTGGRLGEVCEKYPRFFEEYDGFTETGISVSCPSAQGLILSADRSAYPENPAKTDDELLRFLMISRNDALDIAAKSKTADIAAKRLLTFGDALQQSIDYGRLDRISKDSVSPACSGMLEDISLGLCRFILESSEILYPSWQRGISAVLSGAGGAFDASDKSMKAYLYYGIFRFFLKAINTEDIAAVCRLIAASLWICERMPQGFLISTRLFAKEIEHDQDNLDGVLRFLQS